MSERDRLDTAIDHVAARMVAVQDDPDMTLRIVSALPERSSRLGWLVPQFAAFGAIVIAAVVWSMRERPAIVPQLLPSTEIAAVTAFPRVTAREPATVPGTVPVEPVEPLEPLELLDPDFERALPSLELSAIGAESLPAVAALTLAPLEIGELPLTAETISPNKF